MVLPGGRCDTAIASALSIIVAPLVRGSLRLS
ncbi:citrate lyase subunit alpha [Shigella flexneri]